MLDTVQDILCIILIVGSSLLFLWLLERFWPGDKRIKHNDIIGWQLGVLGTTYAVILGFMLYTVWINFGAADLNADAEANAVVNVYRLADGLPDKQRTQIQRTARAYADAVVLRRRASKGLADDGYVCDGKPSPWLPHLALASRMLTTLSRALRLSPASQHAPAPKEPPSPVSYFERMGMERGNEPDTN